MPEFNNGQFEFKNFKRAMVFLACDNCMELKAIDQWPIFLNYHYLDSALSLLTSDELEILITGELDETIEIVNKYNIADIHALFNDIFDGNITPLFFD